MSIKHHIPIAFCWLLSACGSHTAPPARDYHTVAEDPRRDTDQAARENERALALMDRKDWAGAEKSLKQALSYDVMYGPAHNNLGMVYFHQNLLYLAAWEFQYAVKLMPNQPEARNNLGLVFENSGRFDEAVDSYSQAMKLEPDRAQFIGNLARARVRRGDTSDDVRELLSKLIVVDNRPDWTAWARERLALMKPGGGS